MIGYDLWWMDERTPDRGCDVPILLLKSFMRSLQTNTLTERHVDHTAGRRYLIERYSLI